MNEHDDKELRELLRQGVAPVTETELLRDLWPRMLKRLDQQQPIRVPWFDWALAALLSAVLIFFPGLILALLYHF
jgi:hypothetical protein